MQPGDELQLLPNEYCFVLRLDTPERAAQPKRSREELSTDTALHEPSSTCAPKRPAGAAKGLGTDDARGHARAESAPPNPQHQPFLARTQPSRSPNGGQHCAGAFFSGVALCVVRGGALTPARKACVEQVLRRQGGRVVEAVAAATHVLLDARRSPLDVRELAAVLAERPRDAWPAVHTEDWVSRCSQRRERADDMNVHPLMPLPGGDDGGDGSDGGDGGDGGDGTGGTVGGDVADQQDGHAGRLAQLEDGREEELRVQTDDEAGAAASQAPRCATDDQSVHVKERHVAKAGANTGGDEGALQCPEDGISGHECDEQVRGAALADRRQCRHAVSALQSLPMARLTQSVAPAATTERAAEGAATDCGAACMHSAPATPSSPAPCGSSDSSPFSCGSSRGELKRGSVVAGGDGSSEDDAEGDAAPGLALVAAAKQQTLKEALLEVFEQLLRMYKADRVAGQSSRDYHYMQVLSSLRLLPDEFDADDIRALRKLHGVGKATVSKALEVFRTGTLRRAETMAGSARMVALRELTSVYGVGAVRAQQLLSLGISSVAALRERPELQSDATAAYLSHFEELQTAVPRKEIEACAARVARVATRLDARFCVRACGSFRRGEPSSKDVDLLVWIRGQRADDEHAHVLGMLLPALHADGLLVHDLNRSRLGVFEETAYNGICTLGEGSAHRRIDIKVCSEEELPTGLLHFTGSGVFNRFLSRCAIAKGFHLGCHCLYPAARDGRRLGPNVSLATEEDVFVTLGLRYVPPEQRRGKFDLLDNNGIPFFTQGCEGNSLGNTPPKLQLQSPQKLLHM